MADLDGTFLGPYKIVRLLAQGGMARVYQGFQTTLDRDVAIKVIPAHVAGHADDTFLRRFADEARIVARLLHPYIVPIHDFGVDAQWAYLVMEYITSGSVRDHMAHAAQLGQRLSLTWSLLVLEHAAQALDYAHQNNVVHRDVKPANMLLGNPQWLLLSDFGVAKMLEERTIMQPEPQVVGTPQYMSPEQCRADTRLDGRSDIYSLGVVLYQCATGRLPFYGSTHAEVMYKQWKELPPRPSAVAPLIPPSVERIILTAMEKDPDRRYQRAADMGADMHAVRAELEHAQIGPSQRAAPTTPISMAPAPAQPRALVPVAVPVAVPHGRPSAPGYCFRCGSANNPANRHCVACGYDMAAHRYNNDRFLTRGGRPLRCRLSFRTGPFANMMFTLHQDVTTIGRSIGNDILLQDDSVSRQHARLTFRSGKWIIDDVHSSNGIWVNGVRVRNPLELEHGDSVRLGDVHMLYELVS